MSLAEYLQINVDLATTKNFVTGKSSNTLPDLGMEPPEQDDEAGSGYWIHIKSKCFISHRPSFKRAYDNVLTSKKTVARFGLVISMEKNWQETPRLFF